MKCQYFVLTTLIMACIFSAHLLGNNAADGPKPMSVTVQIYHDVDSVCTYVVEPFCKYSSDKSGVLHKYDLIEAGLKVFQHKPALADINIVHEELCVSNDKTFITTVSYPPSWMAHYVNHKGSSLISGRIVKIDNDLILIVAGSKLSIYRYDAKISRFTKLTNNKLPAGTLKSIFAKSTECHDIVWLHNIILLHQEFGFKPFDFKLNDKELLDGQKY